MSTANRVKVLLSTIKARAAKGGARSAGVRRRRGETAGAIRGTFAIETETDAEPAYEELDLDAVPCALPPHHHPVEDAETGAVRGAECECGQWSGERCSWSGPKKNTVLVEFMPEHLCSSHDAAGNSGSYPHNGSRRIRVNKDCAASMIRSDPWAKRVDAKSGALKARKGKARSAGIGSDGGTIRWKGLFAKVYFDEQDPGNPGWFAEYGDEDGNIFSDSQKVWEETMPTKRSASAKAERIALAALKKEAKKREAKSGALKARKRPRAQTERALNRNLRAAMSAGNASEVERLARDLAGFKNLAPVPDLLRMRTPDLLKLLKIEAQPAKKPRAAPKKKGTAPKGKRGKGRAKKKAKAVKRGGKARSAGVGLDKPVAGYTEAELVARCNARDATDAELAEFDRRQTRAKKKSKAAKRGKSAGVAKPKRASKKSAKPRKRKAAKKAKRVKSPIAAATLRVVDADAKRSARLFVNEFKAAWNDATDGDWDATAFQMGEWKGRGDEVRTHHKKLWPRWSRIFKAETRRLVKAKRAKAPKKTPKAKKARKSPKRAAKKTAKARKPKAAKSAGVGKGKPKIEVSFSRDLLTYGDAATAKDKAELDKRMLAALAKLGKVHRLPDGHEFRVLKNGERDSGLAALAWEKALG